MTHMVHILAGLKIYLFWSFRGNTWIRQFLRALFLFLGDTMLHFIFVCIEVTLLCPMLRVGCYKDLFHPKLVVFCCLCGFDWLLVLPNEPILLVDEEIHFNKIISTSTS